MAVHKLSAGELKYYCDPQELSFETTAEIPLLEGMIGQERAVKAMEFGLRIKRAGYNIFMTGFTGTGKLSYALSAVEKIAAGEPLPDDWLYVYNFDNPGEPLALNLPAGKGALFCRHVEELFEDLKQAIPKAFDTEDYERQKAVYVKEFQAQRNAYLEELNKTALEHGFTLKRTSSGFVTVPLLDGEPLSEEDYAKLDQSVKEELEKKSTAVQLKAMEIMRRIQSAERELKEKFKQLDQKIAIAATGHLFNEILEIYSGFPEVQRYLKALQEDVLSNLGEFRAEEEEQTFPLFWLRRQSQEQAELRYKVNLLVDHRETTGAPLVYETNPSYYNLLGRMEYENRFGAVVTDFTMLKAGALHRANGGYLILQANDVLAGMQSWEVLKRALKTKEIRIETLGEQYALTAFSTLRPQPIPLQVKVILIGNPLLYQLLYYYDEDFRKLFKVKVDFDVEMEKHDRNVAKMAGFIAYHCNQEKLRHFDRAAVAKMIEYSARLAEHQEKLSTRFNDIVELLYEADTWAGIEGTDIVGAAHVEKALAEKIQRSNKYEQKILEAIEEGHLLLDLEGAKIGQVNALSVIDLGDYQFGRPSRVTASVYPGRRGIIDIERESKLSGKIHDKGILILSGYLGRRYGRKVPLTLSGSLCFEQSYSGVEGDSASAAELFALISSISGIPLKQGLAVTGSVNQNGEIQPVGGVNSKIEGFFDACKIKGLTGEQGVIIPETNRKNLMLRDEIAAAVSAGKFHLYTVSTVDEGLTLLTGREAGAELEDGSFPPGTVNEAVVKRLQQFGETLRRQKELEENHEQEQE
ncbi:MAG TPA: ATP-binding protein [Bacillota bacterium]|jgi:lon-related putative ATP-dependent protease|nr:ATP-binding protein [Bacillota bacterium]NMD33684.1 AAA family ATPase [Bacillota bacterium]HOB29558.1 ATP-binding protein [Bacillota bacterium]HPZ42188.1 ATP-binding protein [Bacillota bacterium]HQD52990.1 ATP-binding protein [Bacillota bacterium]